MHVIRVAYVGCHKITPNQVGGVRRLQLATNSHLQFAITNSQFAISFPTHECVLLKIDTTCFIVSSINWGATAVDGFPGIKQVAWALTPSRSVSPWEKDESIINYVLKKRIANCKLRIVWSCFLLHQNYAVENTYHLTWVGSRLRSAPITNFCVTNDF